MYRYPDEIYYRVREVGVRKYLVEVPIRKSVRGYVGDGDRFKENIVLLWFYRILYGVLANSDIPVPKFDCGQYGNIGSGKIQSGTGGIALSTDASSEVFVYCGPGPSSMPSTNAVIGIGTDRTRITFSAVANTSASSVMLYTIIPIGSYTFVAYVARKVINVVGGQNIVYYLDFLAPWTYNVGAIWNGIIMNINVNGTAIDGSAYSIQTTGDPSNDTSYLVAASGNPGWAPNQFYLPNSILLSTIRTLQYDSSFAILNYVGTIAPTSDIQIDTLGIQQPLNTTAGAKHFLLAVIPLGQTITLKANRNNVIYLRLVAI